MAFKICPKCNTKTGVRTYNCKKCGYSFTGEKKKVIEPVEKAPITLEMKSISSYIAPKKLTSVEHAKRILSYGKDRASLLLHQARLHKIWSHVDWNVVEHDLHL